MSNKDGGPAFPLLSKWDDKQLNGMTLRDYFAAKALAGELAAQSEESGFWNGSEDALANKCYRVADAMLKAREQQ